MPTPMKAGYGGTRTRDSEATQEDGLYAAFDVTVNDLRGHFSGRDSSQ